MAKGTHDPAPEHRNSSNIDSKSSSSIVLLTTGRGNDRKMHLVTLPIIFKKPCAPCVCATLKVPVNFETFEASNDHWGLMWLASTRRRRARTLMLPMGPLACQCLQQVRFVDAVSKRPMTEFDRTRPQQEGGTNIARKISRTRLDLHAAPLGHTHTQ